MDPERQEEKIREYIEIMTLTIFWAGGIGIVMWLYNSIFRG